MKIRQIKAFLAIVSTGGVRPAAKKLCLTPSTVAKSIGQLESDLGAPLFERSALNLRLNAADPPSSSSSRAAFSHENSYLRERCSQTREHPRFLFT